MKKFDSLTKSTFFFVKKSVWTLVLFGLFAPSGAHAAYVNTYTDTEGIVWHMAANAGEQPLFEERWVKRHGVMHITKMVLSSRHKSVTIPSVLYWESGGSAPTAMPTVEYMSVDATDDHPWLEEVTVNSSVMFKIPCFKNCPVLKSFKMVSRDTYTPPSGYYAVRNGVLFSRDFTSLKKYPEGKDGEEYSVPATVTELMNSCFANTRLCRIRFLGNAPQTVADDVFSGSDSLAYVYYPQGASGWSSIFKEKPAYAMPKAVTGISASQGTSASAITVTWSENAVATSYKIYRSESASGDKILLSTVSGSTLYTDTSASADRKYYYTIVAVNGPVAGEASSVATGWLKELTMPYTVVFNANGGSGTMSSQSIAYGVSTTLSANAFVRNGYKFSGWALSSSDSVVYADCATVLNLAPADGTITLYAVWTSVDFEIVDGVLTKYKGSGGKVTIPSSVTSIGNDAFDGCTSLTSVTISSSVTSIGEFAFYGCSGLTSVTIPSSVTSIGNYAFENCSSLTSISVDFANTYYHSLDGALYNKDVTKLICYPGGATTKTVTIPSSVASIGGSAFWGCSTLVSVTIPSSVTSIGSSAFENCGSLTSINVDAGNRYYCSIDGVLYNKDVTELICCPGGAKTVTIPSSVTSIGDSAFSSCTSLTSVTIPSSVTSIGDSAFSSCTSLTSVTIPSSVTSIDEFAFCGCGALTSATIPSSVTSIGRYVFYNCNSLKTVYVSSGDTSRVRNLMESSGFSVGGVKFVEMVTTYTVSFNANGGSGAMTNQTITYGVNTALKSNTFTRSGYTFAGWSKTAGGSVTYANGASVSNLAAAGGSITLYAVWTAVPTTYTVLFNANGGSGTMTNQTITYGVSAALKSNTFTRSGYTFAGWSKTAGGSVAYANGASVSNLAAAGGSITLYAVWTAMQSDFEIANGVLSKYNGAGGVVTIPSSVTSIGALAFYKCSSLTSVTIPSSVTSIGSSAFENCGSLTSINVDAGNRYYCSIDGVLYNKDVTELICCPGGAKTVTIPSSVASIDGSAFWGCSTLVSVTIPSSVTSIGSSAFENCGSLTSINVDAGNRYYCSIDGVLYNKDATELICCPGGAKTVTIPSSVTSIGDYAFYDCSSLTSVTIPSGVTSIGDSVFEDCSSLISVTIPSSVTSIGCWIFYNCCSLVSVIIPEGVTSIGVGEFEGCTSLTSVAIPSSVTNIGEWETFCGCSALTSVTIPEGVTSIGNNVFAGCSSLTSVTIPSSVTSIAASAFYDCSSLKTVYVSSCDTERVRKLMSASGFSVEGVKFVEPQVVLDVATPVITPTNGATFDGDSCTVTITCATDGAAIYCSADDRTPRESAGYLYNGPFAISGTATIVAFAAKDGVRSDFAEATITKVDKPLTLKTALDSDKIGNVTTGGAANWMSVKDASAKVDGSFAQSGMIGMNQTSWMETTVYGKGTLSFWWKVSCESDPRSRYTYDHLTFTTEEGEVFKVDGESGWQQKSVVFSADGAHVVRWTYSTDDWEEPGYEDCGWVDGVVWTGGAASEEEIEVMSGVKLPISEVAAFMAKYPELSASAGGDAEAFVKRPSATGKLDSDGNQMYIWQDIIAGTDPTNPEDVFRASVTLVDGKPMISWTPELSDEQKALRKYTTYGKAKFTDQDWAVVNSGEEENFNFFKVTVEMLP